MPRGRPRKNPIVINIEKTTDISAPKKRRGRPRKSELNTSLSIPKNENSNNTVSYKMSGIKKEKEELKDEISKQKPIELIETSLHPLPLFMLEMCNNCSNSCKIDAVKGATMIKCPDFKQKT